MEEVRHAVHEHESATSPPGRQLEGLRNQPKVETLLEWVTRHAPKPLREGLRVAMLAPRRHLGAAPNWIPRRVSPLDCTSIAHDIAIAIGLGALEAAAESWAARNAKVDVEAFFVEKDPVAFSELESFLTARSGRVQTTARRGEFGAVVPELANWLKSDAAFVFVDPTGWKGAAMRFIAPLMGGARRDVLVNVMFDHINRFKDDPRPFLREQMRDFFGLKEADLPDRLDEEELFALYRANLKRLCRVKFAADLAIPHPTDERTKFRLVVGGSAPAVVELFRRVERKVVGTEAATVREGATIRKTSQQTGQMSLLAAPPALDASYASLHERGLLDAPGDVLRALPGEGTVRFAELWPALLEKHHITKSELGRLVWQLQKQGTIRITNKRSNQKTTDDDHQLGKP